MGEALIDFIEEENGYVPYPGGAPANVAAHAKLSGAQAVFVGKISHDKFGTLLFDNLKRYEIEFGLERSEKNTALAVITHTDGDRSFQFYRNNTADLDLNGDDIDTIPFAPQDILHFCSLGLVAQGTTREAHHHAIQRCKRKGGIVSFDVNLRERLWDSLDEAHAAVIELLARVDIIKVNETELWWLTDTKDTMQGLKKLQTNHQLVICTLGEFGSCILRPDGTYFEYRPTPVVQIDTTGAGDSYIAMVLASLSKSGLDFEQWIATNLEDAIAHASHVSAQVVQNHGAVPKIHYES